MKITLNTISFGTRRNNNNHSTNKITGTSYNYDEIRIEPLQDTFQRAKQAKDKTDSINIMIESFIPNAIETASEFSKSHPEIDEDEVIQTAMLAVVETGNDVKKELEDTDNIPDFNFEESANASINNALEELLKKESQEKPISIETIKNEEDDTSLDEIIARKGRRKKIIELINKDKLINSFRKKVIFMRYGFEGEQIKSYDEISKELGTIPETIKFSEIMGLWDIIISPTQIPIKLKALFPDRFKD